MTACLIGIVAIAVILGICYYCGNTGEYPQNDEAGTLVKQEEMYGC